jgi:hypothetical protein
MPRRRHKTPLLSQQNGASRAPMQKDRSLYRIICIAPFHAVGASEARTPRNDDTGAMRPVPKPINPCPSWRRRVGAALVVFDLAGGWLGGRVGSGDQLHELLARRAGLLHYLTTVEHHAGPIETR